MTAIFKFGRFELQPAQGRLLAEGAPVVIGPRAFGVLVALVERAGELVAKEELLERVWQRLVVEENNLQVQVSTLRKVLGADAIETVAGQGYRFRGPAERAEHVPVSARARTHSVPRRLTTFVGRERELAGCAQLLGKSRLFTLSGIGGCGKTRLALELAERALPSFPDGVWFVDLASVSDFRRVALTVAATIGVRERADEDIVQAMIALLAAKSVLVVLDNCEHVLNACAELAERLLGEIPGLRVLATSRERLGIPGERVHRVGPLSLTPGPDHTGLVGESLCEAATLFVDRARLAVPAFALDPGTTAALMDICRRLDGIPLAIELAAARVKVLSLEQIRKRLDDRFALLRGSGNDSERHHTLRGVIDWSYQDLAQNESRVLRRLAVFAGGATLEAVTAVAASDDELRILNVIDRLVDKSLVEIDRSEELRYRLLETVRQFVEQKLAEAGEVEDARTRHLAYCLEFAEGAAPLLTSDQANQWVARLESDLPNFLAAHAWCDTVANGAEFDLRLLTALSRFFPLTGLLGLGRQAFQEAFARNGLKRSGAVYASALFAAGDVAARHHCHADARRYLSDFLDVSRQSGDSARVASALVVLGAIATEEGEYSHADALLGEALKVAREQGDYFAQASALNCVGELRRMTGDIELAGQAYEQAVKICYEHKLDRVGILLNLGIVAIERGAYDAARERISEAARFLQVVETRYGGEVLDVAMAYAVATGDMLTAARLRGASDTVYEKIDGRRVAADQRFLEPLVEKVAGFLGESAFSAAYETGRSNGARVELRTWLESPTSSFSRR